MKGVDGIVFVADSQRERFEANIESLQDMMDNLKEYNIDFETLPYVLQLNKRDLPNITPANELIKALRKKNEPVVEAMALKGEGVVETSPYVQAKSVQKCTYAGLVSSSHAEDERIAKPSRERNFGKRRTR